ncbi:putative secreted protein [Sorangium cellulosum So ce56]|uniref:Secreted protein n=2 Tax=Sorangium cellulosum TaxID=56 RepID=A9FB14_SORC5|nr:putative secreted protein [Sorangium cellulosum So ce56]
MCRALPAGMPRPRLATSIALLALISGCAARPQSALPVALAVPPAPAPRSFESKGAEGAALGGALLVWGRTGDGPPRTWHLTEDGAVIREEPGIVVATGRGEWRWDVREVKVETSACEFGPEETHEPGEGTANRAELVLRGTGARQQVIAPPDADGSNVIQHEAEVIGSVGPYLFIEERTYSYACGAHGFVGVEFTVWDADKGAIVNLLAEVSGVPALQGEAKALLDEDEADPEAARQEENAPELVQIAPAYDARGALRVTAKLARAACYACGDGAWSSYTRSAVVPAKKAPARLAAWVPPPPGMQSFLAAHPDLNVGGWSRSGREE